MAGRPILPTIGGKQKPGRRVLPLFKAFKTVTKIVAVLIFSLVGGLLNRIRGGYLNIPQNPDVRNFFWDIIVHDLLARLVLFSLPTGLLVGVLCKEKKKRDPFYFRRVALFVMITLLTWFAMYVSSATYTLLGRDPAAYKDSMGIFDWLLGHDCEDWGFWRRWSREIIGTSLLGLLQTSPAGLWLFFFGYSADYFFSGALMGVIYEIAADVPSKVPGFTSGIELGEFLWGYWTWLILIVSILCHRKNPRNTPRNNYRKIRLGFYAALGLIELVFVGSCICYSFLKQHNTLTQDQSLMGVLGVTAALVVTQILYMISIPILGNRRTSSDYIWYFGDEEETLTKKRSYGSIAALGESVSDFSAGEDRLSVQENPVVQRKTVWSVLLAAIFPKGKKPYRQMLLLIRCLTILALIAFIPLLLYVVVVDGLLHPCHIPVKGS